MALDPTTLAWLAGVASRVASSLSAKVLGAAARGVRKKLAASDKEKALASSRRGSSPPGWGKGWGKGQLLAGASRPLPGVDKLPPYFC